MERKVRLRNYATSNCCSPGLRKGLSFPSAGGPSSRHALEQLNKSELVQVIAEVTETLANFVEKKGLRVITASHFALGRV